jgi:hypothetical protein
MGKPSKADSSRLGGRAADRLREFLNERSPVVPSAEDDADEETEATEQRKNKTDIPPPERGQKRE